MASKTNNLLDAARAAVQYPNLATLENLCTCIRALGHEQDKHLQVAFGPAPNVKRDSPPGPLRDSLPTHLPGQGCGERSDGDYRRAVIMAAAAKWLSTNLTIRKVELLREKMHYLRERGADTTRFENLLADIERDVSFINHIQDALS